MTVSTSGGERRRSHAARLCRSSQFTAALHENLPGRAPGDVGRTDPDQRSYPFPDGIGIEVHELDPVLFDAQDLGRVSLSLADLSVETFAVDCLLNESRASR